MCHTCKDVWKKENTWKMTKILFCTGHTRCNCDASVKDKSCSNLKKTKVKWALRNALTVSKGCCILRRSSSTLTGVHQEKLCGSTLFCKHRTGPVCLDPCPLKHGASVPERQASSGKALARRHLLPDHTAAIHWRRSQRGRRLGWPGGPGR